MACYFISDLHLSQNRLIANGFINWLDSLKDAHQLYILGDFFDLWLGDDAHQNQFHSVNNCLKRYTDQGGQLFFMKGNRDFLVGNHWCSSVQATLLPDIHPLTINNQRWLLLHGDTLCTDDIEYQKMRTILHQPNFQSFFLKQTIEHRQRFANRIRADSKKAQGSKKTAIMDVNLKAVETLMQNNNTQRIIHGHTHRPYVHQGVLNDLPYWRYVLGDWSTSHGWMLRIDKTNIHLSHFPFSTNDL